MTLDGVALQSYQLGHHAVAGDEGAAEMAGLLETLHGHLDRLGVDLTIGFPPPASAPILVRHGWRSAVCLQWYRRLIVPSRTGPRLRAEEQARGSSGAIPGFALEPDPRLASWRQSLRETPVLVHRFESAPAPIDFQLRVTRRSRRARELVIGSVCSPATDLATWSDAVGDCVGAASAARMAPFLSVAVNPLADSPPVFALRKNRFAPTPSSLALVTRTHPDRDDLPARVADPAAWSIGAAAVHTW